MPRERERGWQPQLPIRRYSVCLGLVRQWMQFTRLCMEHVMISVLETPQDAAFHSFFRAVDSAEEVADDTVLLNRWI